MTPEGAAGPAQSWKPFGWQGVSLTVPADWDLVYTRGHRRSGQIRLADSEAVRLEVRWQAGPSKRSPAAAVDAHLQRLRRKARKDGVPFAAHRDLRLGSPVGMQAVCYRWEADRRALAMVSRCTECGRTVHLQMPGPAAAVPKRLARTVFGSLRDHSDGGGTVWRFLDVEFTSPRGFALSRSDLRAGCVRMAFRKGPTRLEFVRASLAQVVLGEQGLAEWFRAFYAKSLKRRKVKLEEAEVRGHPGLQVRGRLWRLLNPLAVVGRRRILRGACWHCTESNRLFICCLDGRVRDEECAAQAVGGFHCCTGEGEG